jgi:hypothetical protein
VNLESQVISVDCRKRRGILGAWKEASARLCQVYMAHVKHDPNVVLTVTISLQTAQPEEPSDD